MYGAINIDETTTNGFYVIQLLSDAYTLQNNTTIYGKVISSGELFVKVQYLCSMQENTNWYWKQKTLQHNIIVPTRTILHPRLEVIIIIYVQDTPKKLCGRSEAKKTIQRHPIIMTDADYDYIWMNLSIMKKISLKGMQVLTVKWNRNDDNNINAIFNVDFHFITIKN